MTGPAKYRKRPVVVEAMQWDGTPEGLSALKEWGAHIRQPTAWTHDRAQVYNTSHDDWNAFQAGDWIVKGMSDEFYPCEAVIFHATYEPVMP